MRTGKPVLLLVVVAAFAAPLHSQTQRSGGGGGESQRLLQQYQQLASEKTTLQAQVTQMKKDLDAAQAQVAALKKERDIMKAHTGVPESTVKQLKQSKETAEKNLETYKLRMNELIAKYRELGATARDVETDRTKLQKDLALRNAAFDKCALDNMGLYDINREVLDRYEHVGLFTKASAAEPFTRITRTRIDNLVDEYRERATELKVKKTPPPATP